MIIRLGHFLHLVINKERSNLFQKNITLTVISFFTQSYNLLGDMFGKSDISNKTLNGGNLGQIFQITNNVRVSYIFMKMKR